MNKKARIGRSTGELPACLAFRAVSIIFRP